MIDWPEVVLSSPDDQTVLKALRNPPPAYIAPAPEKYRRPGPGEPEWWTVVTTATSYTNALVGDMPLLPQDSLSNDMIGQIKIILRTPAWPLSSTSS